MWGVRRAGPILAVLVLARAVPFSGKAFHIDDPRTERLATIEVPGRWPIRLMSHEARAGYDSHGWGLLPFAFSRAPLERFDVFRVAGPPS